MLDKRSWFSLNGIVIIIASFLFVPAAWANGFFFQNQGTVLLLLTMTVFTKILKA